MLHTICLHLWPKRALGPLAPIRRSVCLDMTWITTPLKYIYALRYKCTQDLKLVFIQKKKKKKSFQLVEVLFGLPSFFKKLNYPMWEALGGCTQNFCSVGKGHLCGNCVTSRAFAQGPRRSRSWHRSSKFFLLQTPADTSQFEEAWMESRGPEWQCYVQVST